MTGYPIQPAKVQVPVLRDQTLERDRLLDWLAAKIHHRVILVLADAGYGKTTLLADFSRRTRLRMLWYRLDDDDRDWISFLNHLIERAVVSDLGSGHFGRGIRIAQRALEVDPGVETVEITLLKLYRASGAHAAAAEQYAHYAERLRNELDVAAPPLDSL